MEKIILLWIILLALFLNAASNLIDILSPRQISNPLISFMINIFIMICLFPLLLKKKHKISVTSTNNKQISVKQASKAETLQEDDVYDAKILIDNIPNLFCIKDAKGRWLHADSEYLKIFNIAEADYVGRTDLELSLLPEINLSRLRRSANIDRRAWKAAKPVKEFTTLKVDDNELIFEVIKTPVFDENKNKYRLFVTGHRISQKEILEAKLFSSIFFTSHQAFLLLNSDFTIKDVNASFTRLTGFSKDQVQNQLISSFCSNLDNLNRIENIDEKIIDNPITKDQLWSREITCRNNNDETFSAQLIVSPITIENNTEQSIYYFANIFDITQQKKDQKRIMQLAHYDDLTGLPNRVMFCDRLAQFLSAAKRHDLYAVVMFLDLDRFKAVNDSLGHQAGDELLKEVAKRLTEQTRKEDILARFSGDEFAIVLLNEKSHEKAMYSVSIIAQKIINTLSQKFYIHRQDVFIGVSIGIAIYPEDGNSIENILKHADIAMYEAKKKGRNNYAFFHKALTAKAQDKRKMEVDLRNALLKSEFRIYFQPQYTTETRQIWGAEVLVRWFQHQTKMVPPDYFIPIAEETGLIIPIGTWILESSCIQMKHWLDHGYSIGQLAVNISTRQFMDPNFIDIVDRSLQNAGLSPKYLELEITESMLIGDIKKIELQLNRLKKMGIKIALDDFGTGYSSLSYLKNFPIDILKIDQSFIREMTPDSKDAQIACAIIDMGHSLGQKIVAEGVENKTQFNYLKTRGCDIIQGYFFSPPLPQQEMTKLLTTDNSTSQ